MTSHPSPKPGASTGVQILAPCAPLAEWTPRLQDEGADLVLPLCHLYEDQDEKTARAFDFPLILSGHDHHIVDRMVEGTRIIKPGMDPVWKSKFYGAFTPSTRRLLDSVAVWVSHRSTEPARPRHRREMTG